MSSRLAETFGIMAVDPGKATGAAAGIFRRSGAGEQGSVKATLRRAVRKGAINCIEIDSPYWEQAWELAGTFQSFKYKCNVEYGIPVASILLVVENFALRQMAVDLAPVEVASALRAVQVTPSSEGWHDPAEGVLFRPNPSEAMSYATNDRLRGWGVYPLTRGSEHKRDAIRHLCLGVERVIAGKWGLW